MHYSNILGITTNFISLQEVRRLASMWVGEEGQHQIVSINPEGIVLAQTDEEYCRVINQAAPAIADGFGIQLAARILKQEIPPRVTGIDAMMGLCEIAAQWGWRTCLIGGRGETAKLAAQKLQQQFPGLSIAAGDSLIEKINNIKPQLLFVAFGQPRQELWIARNLHAIPSVKVAMGVGGAFDFLAGNVRRAPKFLRTAGLEWAWRVILQPWRYPRIFNATIRFTWLVVQERLKR